MREYLLPEDLVVLRVQSNIVLFYIVIQVVRAKNFGNFDQLVVVVMSMEKGLLSENLDDKFD